MSIETFQARLESMVIKTMSAFLLFALSLFFPWWVILILLASLFFLFNSFFAGIILGLLLDILYGAEFSFWIPFPFLMFALFCSFFFPLVKDRLIFTPRSYA